MSPAGTTRPRSLSDLPRAIQWLIWAAAGTALFLVWEQYLSPVAKRWDRQADGIEQNVKQVRDGERLARDVRSMKSVVTSLGPVDVPVDRAVGSNALNDAVNSVLEKHGASNFSFGFRPKGKISRPSLPLARNQRMERLTGDVKFDATPKLAAAILADLESSPDIEAIEVVRLLRDSGGKVKAHITVEAWVISTEPARGGPAL